MTVHHSRKELIRAAVTASGRSYAEIFRIFADFDEVLEQHPTLTNFGMGVFEGSTMSDAERRGSLEEGRRALRCRFPTVVRVLFWLEAEVGMIKTPTRSSYELKHVAENSIGNYVSNGELIAAALMAGYPMRDSGGPNPSFAVRQRDIEAAKEAVRQRR